MLFPKLTKIKIILYLSTNKPIYFIIATSHSIHTFLHLMNNLFYIKYLTYFCSSNILIISKSPIKFRILDNENDLMLCSEEEMEVAKDGELGDEGNSGQDKVGV